MEKITFVPEEFNEIKLGYDETNMVKTSPGYPEEGVRMNTLVINTPGSFIIRKVAMILIL